MPSDERGEGDVERASGVGVLLCIAATALLAAFGGLFLWSALAPVASAAMAPGNIAVDGSRRTLQHPDGGVVRRILVREGDLVTEGQEILAFEDRRLVGTTETLRPLLAMKLARRERLRAEREGAEDLTVAGAPGDRVDVGLYPEIVADQRKLLRARREALDARIATTAGEAEQAVEAGKGLRQQIAAQTKRLVLTQTELEVAQTLARSGSGTARRVLEISRVLADVQSELAGLGARAAETDRKVESAALEARRVRATFLEGVENDVGETAREALEVGERLSNALEQFERLVVVAPVTGRIVNLSVHAPGAVVAPGALILEIVPSDSPLVVEAQVSPADIARVQPGLPVEIHVSGVGVGSLPRLFGTVKVVSADRITDRTKANPHFSVLVEVGGKMRAALPPDYLRAGMSVTVMILQNERTVMQYLLEPVLAFFHEGLRES